jgi:catechol 2,3-dioxygenase-like lactoylglutathione lyase family enzyme
MSWQRHQPGLNRIARFDHARLERRIKKRDRPFGRSRLKVGYGGVSSWEDNSTYADSMVKHALTCGEKSPELDTMFQKGQHMRVDAITANLPAISFAATVTFYRKLGFELDYQDAHWMIMTHGALVLEFFPYPDLDPATSSFSACVRVRDVESLHALWNSAALPGGGIPRLSALSDAPWGMRTFHLVDENGSLLRVMEPID